MKTVLKIFGGIGLLLVVVFASVIGKFVGESTTERFMEGKKEGDLTGLLREVADQINTDLPMMVDSGTRLDSTIGLDRQFRYNYTLTTISAEEIDVDGFIEEMRPNLVNYICTAEEMKVFIEYDVVVTYAYRGKNGKQITAIRIEPTECGS